MKQLIEEIRECRVCAEHLEHEPRPVIHAGSTKATIAIVGQAPGTKVHASGVAWNDVSGDNLRGWLGVDKETFYDERVFALVPMGFCFPGQKTVKGRKQDLGPRPECAPLWHERVFKKLKNVELVVLAGRYAIEHYLDVPRGQTLTETVREWKSHGPRFFPTPHPSPRNRLWMAKNPWFEKRVVPALRRAVTRSLAR
ncbi:MAG: uracil-DNA glycosylase family protein [Phycisphaerales bacterium JB043]